MNIIKRRLKKRIASFESDAAKLVEEASKLGYTKEEQTDEGVVAYSRFFRLLNLNIDGEVKHVKNVDVNIGLDEDGAAIEISNGEINRVKEFSNISDAIAALKELSTVEF